MNNRKLYTLGAALFTLALFTAVVFTLWSNSQFRVVNITPGDKFATSSSLIPVDFNRTLLPTSQQPENYVQVFPQNINTVVNINETNLSIVLSGDTASENIITLVIQNVTSVKGEVLSHKLELPVEYVEFNDLSINEQQSQISESATAGDMHPLLSVLPYDNLLFHIDSIIDESEYGKEDDWRNEKGNFIVLIDVFALRGSLTDEQYKLKVLELRGLAEKWILEETGVDPKRDINILFSPSDGDIGIGPPEIHGD